MRCCLRKGATVNSERRLSESKIVSALAEKVCQRITRKVIANLQRMDESYFGGTMLSGDGSGLKNVWDEICAQVQYEEAFSWDAYDTTVRSLLEGYIEELPDFEREAIWLQTQAGGDWDCEDSDDREPYPVVNEDIVNYLASDYVYAEAGRWSNARLRSFIERPIDDRD